MRVSSLLDGCDRPPSALALSPLISPPQIPEIIIQRQSRAPISKTLSLHAAPEWWWCCGELRHYRVLSSSVCNHGLPGFGGVLDVPWVHRMLLCCLWGDVPSFPRSMFLGHSAPKKGLGWALKRARIQGGGWMTKSSRDRDEAGHVPYFGRTRCHIRQGMR